MAKYSGISTAKGYIRMGDFPLDPSCVFESYNDAVEYVNNDPRAYVGQLLGVQMSSDDCCGYIVLPNKTLKKIGISDYSELENKPSIPQKISDLFNDKKYVTEDNLSEHNTKSDSHSDIRDTISVLSNKISDIPIFSGDYDDLLNKPMIPTQISELSNDSGYLTISDIPIGGISEESDPIYIQDKPNIALKTELFSGDYDDLDNKPLIPLSLSQLENDTGFITTSAIPNIPNKTSELENDVGFITIYDIPVVEVYPESDPVYLADKPNLALKTELFDKDYHSLVNKPNIPSLTSELVNDSNFVTTDDIPDTRDFNLSPIDLSTEVGGLLSYNNLPSDIAKKSDLENTTQLIHVDSDAEAIELSLLNPSNIYFTGASSDDL